MPPGPKPQAFIYHVERCCPDLTHEVFFVLDQYKHIIAKVPSVKAGNDLIKALLNGTAPEEFWANHPHHPWVNW